ncbi:MAG: flagellar export chaperone FliS [Pseudomonadota bacterium]
MTYHEALDEYRQVGKGTGATYADPHQLIQLLYDGALDRLAQAQAAMGREEMAECHRLVSEVIGIVEGLDGCLDKDAGGDLADNLHELYVYVIRRLLLGNLNNELGEAVQESVDLLRELREAWALIPVDMRGIEADKAG